MINSVRGVIKVKNKVLLIKRRKEGRTYYVFPGGHMKRGESEAKTCKREVKEETNLDVEVLQKILTVKETGDFETIFYLCRMENYNIDDPLPKLTLIGDERDVNSENNYYKPMWFDSKKLNTITLYPKRIIKILKSLNF